MSVRELLKKKPRRIFTVEPTADAARAAHLLMEHEIGGLPVVGADGALVGFVSEREVVRALDEHREYASEQPIRSLMRKPAPVCDIEDGIREVMERMTRERLRHLVVMEGGRIAGVISVGDLVKHRLQELELETGVLRDYVAAQRAGR